MRCFRPESGRNSIRADTTWVPSRRPAGFTQYAIPPAPVGDRHGAKRPAVEPEEDTLDVRSAHPCEERAYAALRRGAGLDRLRGRALWAAPDGEAQELRTALRAPDEEDLGPQQVLAAREQFPLDRHAEAPLGIGVADDLDNAAVEREHDLVDHAPAHTCVDRAEHAGRRGRLGIVGLRLVVAGLRGLGLDPRPSSRGASAAGCRGGA